ncbi:MAG: hypothetical protein IPM39_12335 [Chloroflexi bacterium]|nr:hypothetical protein [Chloroflexota bacterium]
MSVYLRNEQFIPYERERQMLADLFELPISTGSLQNFLETAAENVKPATKPLKKPSKRPKSVMLMRQASISVEKELGSIPSAPQN